MSNNDAILAACDEIERQTQLIRDEVDDLPPPEPEPPDYALVPEGGNLQAALDTGGAVVLAEGAAFSLSGGYTFSKSNTLLAGEGGNTVHGTGYPALSVPVLVDDIAFGRLTPTSTHSVAVLLGRNDDAQLTLDKVPHGIRVQDLTSSGHRGKRVVEVNAAEVTIINADIRDIYSPEGQDSQAICILNTPGPVTVEDSYLEAASENILVGGDQMKLPNTRPVGLTFRRLTLTKPLAWKTAGTPKVKNIFELKDGHDVLVEDCVLSNCWKSGQDGYGFMLTPTRGGSLRNVLIRNCTMSMVGGIVNITGIDTNYPNEPRTQITMRGGSYHTDVSMPGSGRFCLIGRGPEYFDIEGLEVQHHGSAFIDWSDSKSGELLRVVGCTWNYGSYGVRIGGYNHGDNSAGIIKNVVIEGNTISGAHSSFKSRYPNNTYVNAYTELAAHVREVEWEDRLRRARGDY